MTDDTKQREVYPDQTGPEARKRLARDRRAALKVRRERERLEERMKSRDRLAAGESLSLAAQAQERRRLKDVLERDRDDRYVEQIRREATLQAESGELTNFADTVVPPTPEQLANGDFRTFIPKQPEGTVRVIKSVRRIATPLAVRLNNRGQISDEGLKACIWYAKTHEDSGLKGNIPSVDMGREVFAAPHARTVFTDRQVEAQDKLRKVRDVIKPRYRKFFDAVVLANIPIHRSARFAQLRRERALRKFANLADAAYSEIDRIGELD